MASESEPDVDIEVDCRGIKESFELVKKEFYKKHIILANKKGTQEQVLLVRVKTDGFEIEKRKNYIRAMIMMCRTHKLPGMVHFQKIVQDGLDVFLVQDFNQYGVLKDLMVEAFKKGKPFKEAFVKRWIACLVLAIYNLHQKRMIHSNLHAANLYMDEDKLHVGPVEGFSRVLEDPKLFTGKGDVWKSCELDDLDRANYVSPEVKAGKMPGPQHDIWCIGVLAHFMTTLTFPFQSSSPDRVVEKVLRNQPSFYHFEDYHFSQEFKEWIQSCLHKDPQCRPTSKQLYESEFLKDALQEIMSTQTQSKK